MASGSPVDNSYLGGQNNQTLPEGNQTSFDQIMHSKDEISPQLIDKRELLLKPNTSNSSIMNSNEQQQKFDYSNSTDKVVRLPHADQDSNHLNDNDPRGNSYD